MEKSVDPVLPLKLRADDRNLRSIARRNTIGKILSSSYSDAISNLAFKVCDKVLTYRQMKDEYVELSHQQQKLDNVDITLEETGYEGRGQELAVALSYRQEIEDDLQYKNGSFSGVLHDAQIRLIGQVIENDTSIKTVVNFGASYAYVDHILAGLHAGVHFFGLDRSTATKTLNEISFGVHDNLTFTADDVFEFLDKHPSQGSAILLHSRTATFITRQHITGLYELAHRSGYKYIVGIEPFGISRLTCEPYEFSLQDERSVVYLGGFCIHNYPHLLKRSGYTIRHLEVLTTSNADPDHRQLAFIASA